MKTPFIITLLALLSSCMTFPYIQSTEKTYYVTTTAGDTTCTKEKASLTIEPSSLNTKVNLTYLGQDDSIIIKDAYRISQIWEYAGIDQKGRKYDITIGLPHKGDDIVALWGGKYWTIISYRCYTDW